MADTPHSLLARIQADDAPADWGRLVGLYTPLLARWLRGRLPQDADVDDIVQDVMAVVVVKLAGFRHPGQVGSFRAWLRAILAYRLKTFWRDRYRGPVAAGGDRFDQVVAALEHPDGDLARQWDEEHDRHVIGHLLAQIRCEFAAATWVAFQRYVIDGQPPEAVAAELGVSVNAVFITRSRVIRRLREEAAGLIDD